MRIADDLNDLLPLPMPHVVRAAWPPEPYAPPLSPQQHSEGIARENRGLWMVSGPNSRRPSPIARPTSDTSCAITDGVATLCPAAHARPPRRGPTRAPIYSSTAPWTTRSTAPPRVRPYPALSEPLVRRPQERANRSGARGGPVPEARPTIPGGTQPLRCCTAAGRGATLAGRRGRRTPLPRRLSIRIARVCRTTDDPTT